MARRNVCHRCRHKFKVGKNEWAKECPKCGHGNVGPTDDSPSILPKLIMVVVILAGGAYYFGMLGGKPEDVKKQLEKAADAIKDEVDEQRGVKPTPSAEPAKAGKKPSGKKPKKPKSGKTKDDAPPPPVPQVVIAGRSSAPVADTYFVKGKIRNDGGAEAKNVKVTVVYKDKDGKTLASYEAECPTTLAAGKTAKFESALAGDEAKQVEDFEASVTFD